MEFFQEPAFTAFLAFIFIFVFAKVVSFSVSNSTTNGNTSVCSVSEGAATKDGILSKGLKVRNSKGKKKVKFVDDVVIKSVDRYEGSENLVLLEDVEENCVNEITEVRENQFGDDGLIQDFVGEIYEEQCFDMRDMHNFDDQDQGSEQIEKNCDGDEMDEVFKENERVLEISEVKSVVLEEEKIEVVLESENMIIDDNEGNGLEGCGVIEGLITQNPSIDPLLDTKGSESCHISNQGLISQDIDENEGKVRDESVDYDDDDDWEGIERSELEKVFAEAVNFLEYGSKSEDRLAKLGSDVQMQLYGLHKVAVEGPCHEPQPMALKVSARAEWNSWQKLGNTSQELAMEEYIRILSDNIPGWINNYSADDDIRGSTADKLSVQEYERKLELSATDICDSSTGPSSVEKDKE